MDRNFAATVINGNCASSDAASIATGLRVDPRVPVRETAVPDPAIVSTKLGMLSLMFISGSETLSERSSRPKPSC